MTPASVHRPALAPGQAPPLRKPGPLAEPRSSNQVGFATVLTEYAISSATLSPASVALGQKLFFDARDGTIVCATCHNPDPAVTDGRPVSVGIHGRVGQRRARTILNALYSKHQFWDSPADTLEQQAAFPITNPSELGSASVADAVSRIAGDHFVAGDAYAISDSAKRGWELFNTKACCNKCHALADNERDATRFIDNDFHNVGSESCGIT